MHVAVNLCEILVLHAAGWKETHPEQMSVILIYPVELTLEE